MAQFNKLSPREVELLFLLLEEMGEAQQIIGKILRHGYESRHPDNLKGDTNRQMLEKEMGDVLAALFLLTLQNPIKRADLNLKTIEKRKEEKLHKVIKYLHHQGSEEFYFDYLYKRFG